MGRDNAFLSVAINGAYVDALPLGYGWPVKKIINKIEQHCS
jgi:hypothetical protein